MDEIDEMGLGQLALQFDGLRVDGLEKVSAVDVRWIGRKLSTRFNAEGLRTCIHCNQWLDPSSFNRNPKTQDGLNGVCRDCDRPRRLRWRLWRSYKLTVDDVEELLRDQEGRCAVCGLEITFATLNIDHDGTCCPGGSAFNGCGKCVRGLTCNPCNVGMGFLRHDPEILLAAVNYLIAKAS